MSGLLTVYMRCEDKYGKQPNDFGFENDDNDE